MKNYTVNELRETRARAWEQAKAFLDSHHDANGLVSAENVKRYEAMEEEITNLGKQIEILERREALDAELAKPVGSPLTNKPGTRRRRQSRRSSTHRRKRSRR